MLNSESEVIEMMNQVSEVVSSKVAQSWPWDRQRADTTKYRDRNIKYYKLNAYKATCCAISQNNFYWSASLVNCHSNRLLCVGILKRASFPLL